MKDAQFGARLARVLDTSTDSLPHSVRARLAVAREAALASAPQSAFVPSRSRAVVAAATSGGGAPSRLGRVGALAGGPPASSDDAGDTRWRWLGIVLPVLIVLAGLVSISYWDDQIKAEELADVETAVLTDDVPLETLAERGFGVFLTTGTQP